ncbi:MAG TPA: hypothetical protein DIS78_07350 [Lachnospiraceae bacterium]|nr:hypothetical protein [Lachnospiraceae bacterium]
MRKWLLILLIPIVAAIIGTGVFVVVNATPGDALILSDYFEIKYDGYNGKGHVVITRKDDMLFDEVDVIRLEQKEALIKNKVVENDEYLRFAAGIEAMAEPMNNLKNGDTFVISYLYDEELAKRLCINVDDSEATYTVEGLSDAQPLSVDDLFKDIEVSFQGISPDLTMLITNKSTNPLIKSLVFNAVDYKEKYTEGETVKIKCYFNEGERLHDSFYIDAPADECVREYTAAGEASYVTSLDQIPSSVISEAFEAGKKAFVDANEYGVRIFCEANLVPVYINQQATFRYLNPRIIAAYFKAVNPEEAGKLGNDYNELDLIYEVPITQADGVTCNCEAVVRFSDFVLTKDGSVKYDFSAPSIISASHNNSSIHKNVVTRYEDTYSIEKLEIGKY